MYFIIIYIKKVQFIDPVNIHIKCKQCGDINADNNNLQTQKNNNNTKTAKFETLEKFEFVSHCEIYI